jgi:hypothetical protein
VVRLATGVGPSSNPISAGGTVPTRGRPSASMTGSVSSRSRSGSSSTTA